MVEDGIKISSSLPEKRGDVSLMTLEELYRALDEPFHTDPTQGYNISTYAVYAINDNSGTDDSELSNVDNLKAVGAEWYRQLHRPTATDMHWVVGDHKLFGGPLVDVYQIVNGTYSFFWYYKEGRNDYSSRGYYWSNGVPGSVYVAVVHR